MDEQAEYAVLSKAAYDFFHGGEALVQLELQEYGLGDHSIDEALSDDHAVVQMALLLSATAERMP